MTHLHNRLREARINAGYETTKAAAEKFGWNYPTYAAHENGSRVPKMPTLRRYAKCLGVDLKYLLLGFTPEFQAALEQIPTLGHPFNVTALPDSALNESQGGFLHASKAKTIADGYLSVASLLAPNARSVSFFVCSRNLHSHFLKIGDVLVCDLNAETNPNDTVIINSVNPETGDAVTKVATLYPPYYLPAEGGTAMVRINPDIDAVMAKVVASFRPEYP